MIRSLILAALFASPAFAGGGEGSFAFDGFAPEDGLWFNANEPGSGLTLDFQQGSGSVRNAEGVLTVAIYTYDQSGVPIWYLAAGRIDPLTLVFDEVLNAFAGGSPIDGAEFLETSIAEDRAVRIRFIAPNRAYLSLDGSEEKPIRTFYFAKRVFELGPDDEFAGGRLPEILGRWVFVDAESAQVVFSGTFNGLQFIDPDFRFIARDADDFAATEIYCTPTDDGVQFSAGSRVPACALRNNEIVDGEFVTSEPLLTFHIGDVSPQTIQAYAGPPVNAANENQRGERVIWGFRLPNLQSDFEAKSGSNAYGAIER